MNIALFARRLIFVVLGAVVLIPAWARALEPDQILLVTNKNVPDSARLAAIYSDLRHIPAGRTISLDLPKSEEMDFDTYEVSVVPPIRKFIRDANLQGKITCIVTFYGVPFRIGQKHNTPEDQHELDALHQQLVNVQDQTRVIVGDLEKMTTSAAPTFKPGGKDDWDGLNHRIAAAMAVLGPKIDAMTDPTEKTQATNQILAILQKLGGLAEIDNRAGAQMRADPLKSAEEHQKWVALHEQVLQANRRADELQERRFDAKARAELLEIAHATYGVAGTVRILQAEIAYFAANDTISATDNELALLWWNFYPREKWQLNALNYRFAPLLRVPPVMMVMRLDAPTPKVVENLMHTSVEVEATGLTGIVALDARGLSRLDKKRKVDPLGEYDERIRQLALLLHKTTNLQIKLDDNAEVFPAHSVKNVALYCGWYSVHNYIPGCDFNPGAVAFHIASYEMLSLHGGAEPGWVHGLLNDGVVATLGPCAEPYLSAFPFPEEFFPLLLTGKLSLAEVYWKTTPMTSWMISCIGDPLYTPYKTNPAMKIEDLPVPLRKIFKPSPATEPMDSSRPSN